MRFWIILLMPFVFSCETKMEGVRVPSEVLRWFEQAREESVNLINDISVDKKSNNHYIGTVLAARSFVSWSGCRSDSIPSKNLLVNLKQEEIGFLEEQLNIRSYVWNQDEFIYKKIVDTSFLKLHNKKSEGNFSEKDTVFWHAIKAEFNSEEIQIVHRPMFTKDFSYAIITIEYYSFFEGTSSFNGCITLFCKNENGFWVVVDDLMSAVA